MKKKYPLIIKISFFIPFLFSLYQLLSGENANPAEAFLHSTGYTSIVFLCICLSIQPLFVFTKKRVLLPWKKTTGLAAFWYALLHVIMYIISEMPPEFNDWILDLVKKPFLNFGLVSFLILLVLAITSTSKAIKKLGAKRWKNLHRFVYIAGALSAIHFVMAKKGWQIEPLIFFSVITILLIARLYKPQKIKP